MTNGTFDLTLYTKLKNGQEIRIDLDAANQHEAALVKELFGDATERASVDLKDLVVQYLAHLTKEGKNDAQASCKRTFELWTQSMGEVPLDQLTQGALGKFKRELETRTARGTDRSLAPKTISSHVKNVVAFSYWASSNHDGIKSLTAKGVAPKRRTRQHEERQSFSQDNLALLFGECFDSLNIEQQWLMRLGALTGARIEEICQLSLPSDVRVTDSGTHYLSINEEDENKTTKSANAIREVPIHPRLLGLGVLEFFASQKAAGHQRPFVSHWIAWRGKWSKYPGKWFSTYKSKVLGDQSKLTFHSFRHTAADQFKKASIDEQRAAYIIGHSTGGITYNRYGKPFSVDELSAAMNVLDASLIR